MRGGQPLRRVGPPPCKTCPKESPTKAREHELSARNRRVVELYHTTRAMRGANLTESQQQDQIVQRNLTIVDRVMRSHEADLAALSLVNAVMVATAPKGGQ